MESGAPEAPSLRVFGGIQRRATREKRSGAPKATQLNASLLASKIKAKILNNSSLLKTSLKINNKALAVALSAEKENSRRLKNENLLLQREVDELHFQNVSLREKLICLNKTLIKIEAFLNNNLLTAIEMTTIPEHIAKSVTLEDQCNSSDHQIRSVEQHGNIPYIAKHEGKKQDEIVVCKAEDHLKQIFVLSAEAAADQMSPGLSVAEGMQHSSETNKMETVLVTNIFAKENQSSVEQLSSNALNVGLENESSVGECEKHSKAGRSIENAVSKSTEDTTGIYRVQKNIPVLKSPEILQRHYQGRKGCASIQKGDKVCEESHSQISISDSGNKPLQELTNISIHCLPNPKKDLEEKATTPVRRRRTTVCYKEPSIKSKLRRGDELTDKSFLNSPVFKIKNKPTFKSKSRLL